MNVKKPSNLCQSITDFWVMQILAQKIARMHLIRGIFLRVCWTWLNSLRGRKKIRDNYHKMVSTLKLFGDCWMLTEILKSSKFFGRISLFGQKPCKWMIRKWWAMIVDALFLQVWKIYLQRFQQNMTGRSMMKTVYE